MNNYGRYVMDREFIQIFLKLRIIFHLLNHQLLKLINLWFLNSTPKYWINRLLFLWKNWPNKLLLCIIKNFFLWIFILFSLLLSFHWCSSRPFAEIFLYLFYANIKCTHVLAKIKNIRISLYDTSSNKFIKYFKELLE